jgi:hypothetical protein
MHSLFHVIKKAELSKLRSDFLYEEANYKIS